MKKIQESAATAAQKEVTPTQEVKNQVNAPKKVTIKKKVTKAKVANPIAKVAKGVAKQQEAALIEAVTTHREVKYKYPKDCVDQLARKKWRQSTRNELAKLEKEWLRVKDQNSKEAEKKLKAFEKKKAEVLKEGVAVA